MRACVIAAKLWIVVWHAGGCPYVQPLYIGDPRPHDSVLRWMRGSRQPSDPAGGAVFNPMVIHPGVWSDR